MFHLIKEWKLVCSGNKEMSAEWAICIEKDFTQEELQALQLWAILDEENNVVITQEIEDKIELENIEERLRAAKEKYTDLEKMWQYRSNKEELEFQALETAKNTLFARRKQILDSMEN